MVKIPDQFAVNFKYLLKEPLRKIVKPVFSNRKNYGYSGNYASWAEAKKMTRGYDSDIIVKKVKDALLKVKNGEAAYERDSVLFDTVQYSWPLLAGLMWIASRNSGKLNVLDFGGSLGSTYFQNIRFHRHLHEINWNIVEQKSFVECGRKHFEDASLKFFYSVGECLQNQNPDTLIFSGSLQYIEHPYRLLQDVIKNKFEHIIFDITNFIYEGTDRITILKVPPEIYDASYPAWFFNYDNFRKTMAENYDLIAEFNALGGEIDLNDAKGHVKGMIFKIKDSDTKYTELVIRDTRRTISLSTLIKRSAEKLLPKWAADPVRKTVPKRYGFFGNYANWEDAKSLCTGYDSDIILQKVKDALLKVRNGEAVHERDSVLFDTVQYSWPLLAGLMWGAAIDKGRLNVIDFGGSLGSSYFQNRNFLHGLDDVTWSIIEQYKFVECGKKHFADERLRFYSSIEECLGEQDANVIILSSVLQYIEQPYGLLKDLVDKKIKHILFDRTTFIHSGPDRITVQKVPPEIYEASYPAWFFNYPKFRKALADNYELIAEYDALGGEIELEDTMAYDKGMIFRLRQ